MQNYRHDKKCRLQKQSAFMTEYILILLIAIEWSQVVALDILEVVHCTYLQFNSCCIVANDDTALVHLKNADSPHLCDVTLNSVIESLSLVVTVYKDKNLLCIHNCAYTYCNCSLGHLVDVVVKETRVCNDCIGGQCFDTCA